MNINGLKVDAAKIGHGLYAIIEEKGEEAIVAFGMVPKWAIDMAERAVRDKVVAIAAEQIGCTVDEFKPFIDEDKVKQTVQPILHEITLGIYDAASKAGKLLV